MVDEDGVEVDGTYDSDKTRPSGVLADPPLTPHQKDLLTRRRVRESKATRPGRLPAESRVAPPPGVPTHPPDSAPPSSLLAKSAPPWERMLAKTSYSELDKWVGEGAPHVKEVEQQICLLARYVMLQALWEREGWSKKEHFDAAVAAVKAIEGAKGELWVKTGPRDYTTEEYAKERAAVEARLTGLLTQVKMERRDVVDAAAKVIEVEKVN